MIGQTISHYRILEELGEVPIRLFRADVPTAGYTVGLSIPPLLSLSMRGGSGRRTPW